MKDVKKIELVFENCDYVEIQPEDIANLVINNISEKIRRIACNSISKYKVIDDMVITLTRNANKQYAPLGFIEDKEYIFDRITGWNDITSIDITYEDDTTDYITVTWTGDSDYNNDSQHSLLTPQGNLIIVIGNNVNSVEDYLHKEDLTVEDIDDNCKFYIKIK